MQVAVATFQIGSEYFYWKSGRASTIGTRVCKPDCKQVNLIYAAQKICIHCYIQQQQQQQQQRLSVPSTENMHTL